MTEYAVLKQVINHFQSNDLFHPNHHGFLPHRNTTAAENKELSAALFIDLSAAFDILDHKILDRNPLMSSNSLSVFFLFMNVKYRNYHEDSKLNIILMVIGNLNCHNISMCTPEV